MRTIKPLLFLALLFLSVLCHAQPKVTWGEEFKMRRGSTELTVIKVDQSGIYLEEAHVAMKSYFVIGYSVKKSGTLVKLDASRLEQFRNDFDKELKGKEFSRFFFIRDKLYLFATNYEKRENSLFLHAAEIDKSSGDLKGGWKQVAAWEKLEKSEGIDFAITHSSDSTKIVLSTTFTGKAQNRYEVRTMDAGLQPVGTAINLSNEFDPKTFQVQDLVYTATGNVVLVGRIYEYEEGKKKKEKFLLFKNYNIRMYDQQGKLKKELVTDIDNKFLVSGKMIPIKGELVLAAFYSNEKKKKEINGMLVQRIDATTGNVIVEAKKEMSNALITEVEADDPKAAKKDKEEEEEGLDARLVFRKFYLASDNGLIILAEKYRARSVTSSTYSPGMNGMGGSWRTTSYLVYECGDLYMSKVSSKGNIEWLHVLPKEQTETITTGSGRGAAAIYSPAELFFEDNSSLPFYAGFGCLQGKDKLHILFNDHERNIDILQPGRKIKSVSNFGKSMCYELTLDMLTGKYIRKNIFSNDDIPAAMPRLGVAFSNTFYLTGQEPRFLGKNRIAVGSISFKD